VSSEQAKNITAKRREDDESENEQLALAA